MPYRSPAMTNGRSVRYGFDRLERGTHGTVGRKTKLTPELKAGIVSSVRKGLSNKAACRVAGINETNVLSLAPVWRDGEVREVLPVPERGRGGFQGLEPRRHPTGRTGAKESRPKSASGRIRTAVSPRRSSGKPGRRRGMRPLGCREFGRRVVEPKRKSLGVSSASGLGSSILLSKLARPWRSPRPTARTHVTTPGVVRPGRTNSTLLSLERWRMRPRHRGILLSAK